MSGKILITGGSGLVGMRLSEMLIDLGYEVAHLSRNPDKITKYKAFKWDFKDDFIDDSAITYADYIIHLAGANVGDEKWTEDRKKEIYYSRVKGSDLLYRCLKESKHHVKALISASGISIYGNSGEQLVSEESTYADDFLADVCKVWEAGVWKINELGIRIVILRLGIVLSRNGGALPQMALPMKLMAGAPLGSGRQYMSWIHIDDLCRIFIKAMEDRQMEGVYNAVAPHPVTNKEFMQELSEVMHRPLVLPKVPAFAINFMFGEKSEVVLVSQRVSANKIMHTGFTFEYNYLKEALESLYGHDND
ncbi:TIGR01777 family protein [Pontibacter sp. 172403-2]|uniref:TIGR01777 family oxidoreductase n=1 Tax=Pontibacter rufus TaxID=2791028 RepID=UPI0018B00C80|nr:TIGR01777 family oxidoreductase [Pontibacter sp. 172403-2]MBF9253392.1 TIGR01777 family protein [Pontibacter sp. 172403-2]